MARPNVVRLLEIAQPTFGNTLSRCCGKDATVTHRKIEIVRGMWGLAALIRPRTVLRGLQGDPDDRASQVTMRVLGARQLSQALLSGVSPSRPALAIGVWVDAIHAVTAVGLAVVRPGYAAPALADAVIAGTWAVVGRHDLRTRTDVVRSDDVAS